MGAVRSVVQQARDCGVSMPRRRLSQPPAAAAGLAAMLRQLDAEEGGMEMTTGAVCSLRLRAIKWASCAEAAGAARTAMPGQAVRSGACACCCRCSGGGEAVTRLRLAGCSNSCGGVHVATSGGRLLAPLLLRWRAGVACAGCSGRCCGAAAAALAAAAAETTAGAALCTRVRMKTALSLASTPPRVSGTATLSWGRPRRASSSLDRPAEKLCCRQAAPPSRATAAHWKASWRSRSMKYTAGRNKRERRRARPQHLLVMLWRLRRALDRWHGVGGTCRRG